MGTLAIAVFWGLALWGVFSPRPVLFYLFFACLPLGTFAVIPPALTGGLSLLGSPVAVLLLAVKELGLHPDGPRSLARLALQTRSGRLLMWYWAIAATVTIFAPTFFAGDIEVIPMSGSRLVPTPLAASSQNFSQLSYLTLSVLSVFTFARMFRSTGARMHLHRGLLVSGTIAIATGIADYLSARLPLGPLLANFRTANYAILDDVSLQDGARRVIGLMSEASSFGALSVSLFASIYFLRPTFPRPRERRLTNGILCGLLLMTILSTSSAGYVALSLMFVLILVDWFSRASGATKPKLSRQGTRSELAPGLIIVILLTLALLLIPSAFDPVVDRVNDRIVSKVDSDSFDERSMWTEVSLNAGLSSHMIGVGLGSTRASNHLVAVFASTGILGLSLYVSFMMTLLFSPIRNVDPIEAATLRAFRWSVVPPLAVEILSGTTPDFGVLNGLRWGIMLVLCSNMTRTRSSSNQNSVRPFPAAASRSNTSNKVGI